MQHRTRWFASILFILATSASHAAAQAPVLPDKPPLTHTAAAARADLAELYKTLRASHFDLFVHRSKAEYDARYAALRRHFDKSFSHFELQVALQKFMAFGRVAHSRIDFPSLEFERYRATGGGILPVQLKVRDGRAYVVADQGDSADPAITAGEEITAINGAPFPQWRRRLLAHISADNDRLADTLLELRFGALLWIELGPVENFDLRLTSSDGTSRSLTRHSRSRESMQASLARQPKRLELDWSKREARMLDAGIAYLRPGPFFDDRPDAANMWDPSDFATFIDTSMAGFAQAAARSLVIDLRDNPGGDNSFSDLLARRYADQQFRFASTFTIKVSKAAAASNAKRMQPGDTGISAQFAKAYAAHEPGEIIEFPIETVDPAPAAERFKGRVFVLINRYTYSNSVMLAALSQDFHFATILGEETADLASTYGAMEQFTLSRSGIVVGFPKAHLIRPSGDEAARGVIPDIAIESPLLEGSEDPVLRRALTIVTDASKMQN
ncbi:MAG: S41 family peptidase [Tahibacter sp.]